MLELNSNAHTLDQWCAECCCIHTSEVVKEDDDEEEDSKCDRPELTSLERQLDVMKMLFKSP